MSNRRSVFRAALGGAALMTAGRLGAQSWPERSIRFIVPAAPGPFDAIARLIGERLGKALGQPVVIDNILGATGTIGTAAMARAAPDGYTISLGIMPLTIGQTLFPKLSYDIRRDVAPIVQISWGYNILVVHPSLPVKSVAELVAYAKVNPGKINYGSGGNGAPAHIAAEFFKLETGSDMVHVPFKSAAPAVQELLAGRIQVMFGLAPGVILVPHHADGREREFCGHELQWQEAGEMLREHARQNRQQRRQRDHIRGQQYRGEAHAESAPDAEAGKAFIQYGFEQGRWQERRAEDYVVGLYEIGQSYVAADGEVIGGGDAHQRFLKLKAGAQPIGQLRKIADRDIRAAFEEPFANVRRVGQAHLHSQPRRLLA